MCYFGVFACEEFDDLELYEPHCESEGVCVLRLLRGSGVEMRMSKKSCASTC